jgi:predicted HTH domain antitoxin
MTIELPDQELIGLALTPESARVEFAVGLYAGRALTMGRAARIAGIAYRDFMHEIGRRGICIDYGVEDALHDVEMAKELRDKAHAA